MILHNDPFICINILNSRELQPLGNKKITDLYQRFNVFWDRFQGNFNWKKEASTHALHSDRLHVVTPTGNAKAPRSFRWRTLQPHSLTNRHRGSSRNTKKNEKSRISRKKYNSFLSTNMRYKLSWKSNPRKNSKWSRAGEARPAIVK